MGSRIYAGGCLTPGQITALESIGVDEEGVKSTKCRVNNTCGRTVKEVLSDPNLILYDPLRKFYTKWGESSVPWTDESEDPRWGFAKFVATYSYPQGTQVLYLSNNGHTLTVYEAVSNIEVLPGDLDPAKWSEVCSIDSAEQIELYTYESLISKYPYYSPDASSYSSGKIVLFDSDCGNLTCMFLAIANVPTDQIALNPPEVSSWKRVVCVENGKPDKCIKSASCDQVSLSDGFSDLICLPDKGTNL